MIATKRAGWLIHRAEGRAETPAEREFKVGRRLDPAPSRRLLHDLVNLQGHLDV